MPKSRNHASGRRRGRGSMGHFAGPQNSSRGLRRPHTQIWNQLSMRSPVLPAPIRDNREYKIAQIYELGPWLSSSAGGAVSTGIAFNLTQIPGVSSLTAVFDQYKINAIEAWIQPTQATTTASPDGWRWYNVVDYDDDATSISESAIQQYANVTDCARTEACYRKWVPHVAVGVNVGNSTVLALNEPAGWINSANTGVKHFGIKVLMQSTAISVVLTARFRFHLSFRNVF